MTTYTPIYRLPLNQGASEDGPFETFFAPQFSVVVSGQRLQAEVIQDVIQVSYRDSLEDIDSFELTISNYESGAGERSQSVRTRYEPPSRDDYEGLFDPGNSVELYMGYADRLRLMLKGTIVGLEPKFPASGGMTLTVRGLNALHQFRAGQHTHAWEGVKDSDIAAEIGRNPLSQTRPGINFPLRTDPTAREAEVPDRYVFMNNQYDIVFLMERARRRDYVLVLKETDQDGNPDPHIYFGPSNNHEVPAYELEWGKTLVSFNPTLTTANQVSEVVVLGWDRQRNRRIEGKASWESLIPRRDRAEAARQQRLMQAFGNRREVITDQPVRDENEANDRARRILRELRKGMVEANGETVGLPGLLAGRKVRISNLGERFSGEYYVTETTHTIGNAGYRTTFKARREEGLAENVG